MLCDADNATPVAFAALPPIFQGQLAQSLAKLTAMGFDDERSNTALIHCGFDANKAALYLIGQNVGHADPVAGSRLEPTMTMLEETIVTRRRARAVEPESFADTHAAGAVTRYSNLNKKDSDSD